MKIELNLDKDFEIALKEMADKYGEKFELANGFHNENLNFTDFIDAFTESHTLADISIDGNANNSGKDVSTLMSDMVKPHTKLLSFNKLFYELKKKYGLEKAKEWLECEYNGTFYMHNSPAVSFKPYCFAYDLDHLAEKGLDFTGGFKAEPAKHLNTFNNHILQFISWNCNRTTGAVGVPSYLVYSFYFWKKDVESGYYTKSPETYRDQEFQSFIYNLNQPFMRISESAFTNVTIMDGEYFDALFGDRLFPDGTPIILHKEEFMEYQKAFMRVVSKVRAEQMMTFPVLTYSLLYQNGKFVDEEFARWCSDHNCEWNDSNFYVGNDVTVLSNCCRLLSDMSEFDGFINSIGGTSLKIGSVAVNTLNLRRMALISKDEDELLKNVEYYTNLSLVVLDTVRNIIKRNIEKGLLPNYTYGLIELERQFNTLGITAMYECLREFGYIDIDEFGAKSYSDKAMSLAERMFNVMNDCKSKFTTEYKINIECVPAERANVVLCEKDIMLYGNNFEDFIYSNQWIPLMENCTISEKIRLGSILDKQCGGGAISHINIEKPFANKEQAWEMLNHIASQGLIYFAFNTKISACKNGHAFYGDKCPKCGEPVADVYTRVVGFLTPRSHFSKHRRTEFDKRKWFNV